MQHSVVSVISGGWSASQVDLARAPGFVIGVNNAAIHAPRVDAAISMDRRWAEAYWPWAAERSAVGEFKLWLRPNNVLNITDRPDWLQIYRCNHRTHIMSDEAGVLNGTNSGGVALNLSYSMRPKTVYLFGFDYRPGPHGEPHWFENSGNTGVVGAFSIHNRRYAGWAKEFDAAGRKFIAAGIDVVNVSDTSIVRAFRRLSPSAFGA